MEGDLVYEKRIHNTRLSTMPTHTWNKVIHFCCSVSSITEILYYISAQNVKMLKNSINLFLLFLSNNNKSCILANKSNHIRKWKIENVLTVIKKYLLETVLSIFYEAQTIRRHVIIVEENYGLLKNRYLLCTAYLLVF